MKRVRAFNAIIHKGKIAMIYNIEPERKYWTLPGGGVENNENLEETAIREAYEEANLNIRIIRYLYKNEYNNGIEHCFLSEPINPEKIKTGYDPEFSENEQIIIKAEWRDIIEVKNDIQVSLVLKNMTKEELDRYKIYIF